MKRSTAVSRFNRCAGRHGRHRSVRCVPNRSAPMASALSCCMARPRAWAISGRPASSARSRLPVSLPTCSCRLRMRHLQGDRRPRPALHCGHERQSGAHGVQHGRLRGLGVRLGSEWGSNRAGQYDADGDQEVHGSPDTDREVQRLQHGSRSLLSQSRGRAGYCQGAIPRPVSTLLRGFCPVEIYFH